MLNSKDRFRALFVLVLAIFCLSHSYAFAQTLEITEIKFKGVKSFETGDLIELLHSEEDDEFDARLVKLDKILLTNFYRTQGFLIFSIYDSLIVNKSKGTVKILYDVTEGQRYYLGRVEIEGNELFSYEKLLSNFEGFITGNPFDEGAIKAANQTLEDLYHNNGKPFVNLKFDYEIESDSLIVIKCSIKENQTITIQDVEYVGLNLVKSFIIYRELSLKRWDIYSKEKLAKSHRNLYRTGLIEYVRFELKPTVEDSTMAILRVQIQEKDPRWVGVSVGFTHEDEESYGNKLEFSLEGGHRNLFGTGRSISLHLVPSLAFDVNTNKALNPDNHVSFIFVEPWIGYTRTPGVFLVDYHLYRPQNSANFNALRFNFGVHREISEILNLSGSLEAKLVTVFGEGEIDTTLAQDADRNQVYTVSLYGKRDKRNNFFSPTNGSFTDVSLGYSYSVGKLDDGSTDIKTYITLISAWRRYQPLKWKPFKKREGITLATRVKGGALIEFGPTKTIPISDLFFAGGATTVRGYQEQLLGPTTYDSEGLKYKALGGKLIFLANAEFRVPIWWLFVGEIFLDAGNVWREIDDFNPKEIKFSTGLGIALLTPVGPVRFDYGIKLNKIASDKSADAFHFGLYFAF
jgi:outer membrane protein insertion porin family